LNSTPVRLFVASYALSTAIATHPAGYIKIPRFESTDAGHAALVTASRAAKRAVASGKPADEDAVDVAAARLWKLTAKDVVAMRDFLDVLRRRDLAQ